jgi:hypothetical protein
MILESVSGVDEDFHGLNEKLTSNSLNVETMHLQCDNYLVRNDEFASCNYCSSSSKMETK